MLPLLALSTLAGAGMGLGANLYSQHKQRQLYDYQKAGYQRWLNDYAKNVGRPIRYPEMGPEGKMRALDTGISQSHASSLASVGGFIGSPGVYHATRTMMSRWL